MLDFLFQVPFMLVKFLFNLTAWAALFYYGFILGRDEYHNYKEGHYDKYFKS
tara:strand:- start:285 stop:440 length:156 start_codon:yes stop_codon:yes gene_type:complete